MMLATHDFEKPRLQVDFGAHTTISSQLLEVSIKGKTYPERSSYAPKMNTLPALPCRPYFYYVVFHPYACFCLH